MLQRRIVVYKWEQHCVIVKCYTNINIRNEKVGVYFSVEDRNQDKYTNGKNTDTYFYKVYFKNVLLYTIIGGILMYIASHYNTISIKIKCQNLTDKKKNRR